MRLAKWLFESGDMAEKLAVIIDSEGGNKILLTRQTASERTLVHEQLYFAWIITVIPIRKTEYGKSIF